MAMMGWERNPRRKDGFAPDTGGGVFAKMTWPMPRVLILSLILAASTITGVDAQQRGRGGDGRPTRVVVDAVREEPLVQTIPVLGRLVPRQAGVIAARIAGPVAEIHVQVGDRVKAGATLAAIDSATLKWTRAMRAADVAEQGASVSKAESEVALTKQELARLESLRSSAAFSEARYNDKRRDVDRTSSVVGEARAKLQSARANLNMAETNLAYAVIKAPYPGVITHRYAEVGAYLKVGDSAFSMINDTNLEVEADVPVTRLAGIVPGAALSRGLRKAERPPPPRCAPLFLTRTRSPEPRPCDLRRICRG